MPLAEIKHLRALEKQLSALRRSCVKPHVAANCCILQELVAAAHQESRSDAEPTKP